MAIWTILIIGNSKEFTDQIESTNYKFEFVERDQFINNGIGNDNPDILLFDMTDNPDISLHSILDSENQVIKTPCLIKYNCGMEIKPKEFHKLNMIDFIHEDVFKCEFKMRIEKLMERFTMISKQKRQLSELNELTQFVRHQKQSLDETLKLQMQLGEVKESAYAKEVAENKRKMVAGEVEKSKIQSGLKALLLELKSLQKNINSDLLPKGKICNKLKEIQNRISSFVSEKDRKTDFLKVFEKIEPTFFKKLINTNSRLTPLDLKHCAYIRLNVDNYELANIFNVEMKSLQMSRYRLKKKLNLEKNQTLREYLLAL